MAKHNAAIYGATPRIHFVTKDFLLLDKAHDFSENVEVVFVSPPWGGVLYAQRQVYDLNVIKPAFSEVLRKALSLSDNVVLFLPRNVSIVQLADMLLEHESLFCHNHHESIVTLEAIIYGGYNIKVVVAYIGPLFQVRMPRMYSRNRKI